MNNQPKFSRTLFTFSFVSFFPLCYFSPPPPQFKYSYQIHDYHNLHKVWTLGSSSSSLYIMVSSSTTSLLFSHGWLTHHPCFWFTLVYTESLSLVDSISTMKLWCLLLLLLSWQKLALLDLSYWPAKKKEKNMVAVRVS